MSKIGSAWRTPDEAGETARLAALLEDSQERLRLLGQAIDDVVWDWNLLTGEVDWNQAAAALFGDDSPIRSGMIGWWERHIHADDRQRVIDAFAAAIAGEQVSVAVEYRFCRADKSIAYIYDRGSIMRDADHVATRMVGSMIDLTHLRVVAASLAKTEATLIHVARHSAMGTMASMIAHELNQPLAAITNYIRAARRITATSPLSACSDLDDVMCAAEENALRAGGIIRRLRELVQRGQVERRPTSAAGLIDDARTIALMDAERLGISCDVTIAPATPLVLVDPTQIQQVIINLIRNAVDAFEAPDNRRIWINARPDKGFVELSIADNGPGIDPEMESELFLSRISSKATGMGIGLSICRTIVEAHGGTIWAGKHASGGADFRFTLPADAP